MHPQAWKHFSLFFALIFRETKMGLNVKDMHLRFCRVLQVSAESSYKFIQRHPLVSGAMLVSFILYVFLSYIYSFLVYLSPFLVCTTIFVRIFWSSEQIQLKYVKVEEEKVEPKLPKIPNNGRRELLYKYPSQNATSRRRNFRQRKWDVYGGLEEKAKNLSEVFRNDFTKRTTENREAKSFEKWESYLDYGLSAEKFKAPKRQSLSSEPSMRDLVEPYGAECGGAEIETEKIEDGEDDDEEEEESQDRNKAVEWTEDDQKNLMDLGISEIERNRRLESLMARRRARKLLKSQIENGLSDTKSVPRSQIAPLFITRGKPFDSAKDFEGIDGLEMPGSAPSVRPPVQSPFDLPYEPSEEKPNLMGDNFHQDFTCNQMDMPFCRHESFSLGRVFPLEPKQDLGAREPYPFFNNGRKVSDRLTYPRSRRPPDKGNHDWLIEQLFCKEGGEIAFIAPNPLRKEKEATHEEDGKCKIDMTLMKHEEVDNAHTTKLMSDHASKPDLIPNISNVETARVSENPGPRVPKPHERFFNFPISTTSTTTTTTMNESLYSPIPSPVNKNQENMFFTDGRICHTPTYSIASDLHVEVSEVGSPTSMVGESPETNTSTDGDSVVYDGDIDRDISSGSEELWGASFHGRGEVRGVNEEDIEEVNNNSKDIDSPFPPRQIEEEIVTDVSSLSSRSDMPEDTPTHARHSDHNMKDSVRETEAPQSSNSSHVSSPHKLLMDSSVDHLPNETHSEKPEEWSNQSENLINEAQVINDMNNSASTEQDNTENSKRNENPSTSVVRQESIDEVSIISISSSSPRSVLPEKTIEDQVSSSSYNQQMHIGVHQSNMEDMAQATLNGEHPPDTMPQNILPLMDEPTVESHNGYFNSSQTNPPEKSLEESNILGKMNGAEVYNREEEEKLKNDENNEDRPIPQIRQEPTVESARLAEKTTTEDMDEKSREVDGKVPSNSLMVESSSEVHRENEDKSQTSMRQEASAEPFINAEATDTSSAKYFEGKHNGLNKIEATLSSGSVGKSDKLSETVKPSDSPEEVNYLQSESKELNEDDMEKEKLDRNSISDYSPQPMVPEVTNSKSAEDTVGKSDDVNKNEAIEQELKNDTMASSESVGENDKVSSTSHMKEAVEVTQLEDANAPKPNKPNDSSDVGYSQGESTELVEDDVKDKQTNGNTNEDLPQPRVTEPTIPNKEANEGHAEDS